MDKVRGERPKHHPASGHSRSVCLSRGGKYTPRPYSKNDRVARDNKRPHSFHNRGQARGRLRYDMLPSSIPRYSSRRYINGLKDMRPLNLLELKQIHVQHSVYKVTRSLSDRAKGLSLLLNTDRIGDEEIEVLIHIFVKIFEHKSSGTTKKMLDLITGSTFLKKGLINYVAHLGNHLKKDERDKSQVVRRIEDNVDHLIKFLEIVLLLPDMTRYANDIDVVVTLLDLKCLEWFSAKLFSKEALTKVMRLKKLIKKEVEEAKEKEKKIRQRALAEREGISDGPPPDDYRDIPILPTPDNLRSRELPFLRPNIVKGSYSSHYHYLDVQFRLLREDFVCPLRNGIQTYLSNLANPLPRNQRKRNTDVRLYYDVTIEHPVFTHREEGVLYRVKFSLCNLKRINWKNTKRLIYGSLVCLSHDNFQTLLFGTVTEREISLLRRGMVDIKLHNIENMDPARVYTMVESTAFYESYRPVLEVLQQFNEDSIPMEKYIIRASNNIQQPKYLRGRPGLQYDIQPLSKIPARRRRYHQLVRDIDIGLMEDIWPDDDMMIDILNEGAWPDTDKLGLDASQLRAVKSALTKELAIIQGPPGTGKTYIGLKIVETLLINREFWRLIPDDENRYNGNNAIMVICYTNHALDQFLEGILEFCPNKLVRIGGRSKSEKLQMFNLTKLAKRCRLRENEDTKKTVDLVSKRMIEAEEMIQLCDRYIISEYKLEEVINDKHFRCLSDSREEYGIDGKRSILPTWLGLLSDDAIELDSKEHFDEDAQSDEDDYNKYNSKNVVTEFDVLQSQRENQNYDRKGDLETRQKISIELYSALAYNPNMKCKDAPLNKHRGTVLAELSIKNDKMSEEEANSVNIRRLSIKNKWRLYRYWITKYRIKLRQILFDQQRLYDELVGSRIKQQVHEAKCDVLRGANVIGMTTTGAARNKSLLNEVRPRIVIVEEAAEILEAHIVTSLTQRCEHLILIGDHQQLKPNPTVYKLAKKFNLDTSLFERMLKNDIPCQKLSSQHRMRPEIADIMRNHFYDHLLDDESVKQFDDIAGVSHNLFFINHDIQEQADEDILSKSNVHEAEYCVALARYFVQQGYEASEITILTTYTGQVLSIKRILKSHKYDCLRDIYVSAVDNYQGKENKIILLSLVRSNEVGNIGFLKISNRMCVGLSRAKIGLFCIGNFNLLSENNKLWMKIVNDMRSKNLVGNHLELCCRNHPKTKVYASVANDFDKCPLGGCTLKCETRLDCGHVCSMLCHPQDRKHKEYKCKEKCARKCVRGHDCPLRCFCECCPCTTLVNKTLDCQHDIQIECKMFDEPTDCTKPCERVLQCGHKCRNPCFDECTRPAECQEIVTKLFTPCDHKNTVQCCVNSCQVSCEYLLKCGHSCKEKCGNKCTVECMEEIEKTFQCGHTVSVPCFTPTCPHPCTRERDCGHSCLKQCGDLCGECLVKVNKELICGHHKILPCHEDVERWSKVCRQMCLKKLSCGHQCKSACSVMCSTLWCTELVTKKLACGHEKDLPCNVLDPNKPIEISSSIRLGFGNVDVLRCEVKINVTRKCGHGIKIECWEKPIIDLTDCRERVVETLSCGHNIRRVCSENGICYNRCTRALPCGHSCNGICSEPCTEKCKAHVEKKLKCEHMKMVRCFVDVSQMVTTGEAACQVKLEIVLPCGHKETQLCCRSDQPITCKQKCSRKLICGHLCTKKCVEECSVNSCRQRCKFTLACGHRCEGDCKDCLNGHFHRECKKYCNKRLVCGHSCQQMCSILPCQPCKEPCQSCCSHKTCRKTCSQICEPCKSPCDWNCRHYKCTKACDELCNRRRCDIACRETLKCNHRCVSLCGERCVCLECNQCTKISSTTIPGSNQKYIFLYDCSHAIEVFEMDQYMDKDEGVRRKKCPLCQTTIRYNPRYGNVLKRIEYRINIVKQKTIAERSMKQVQKKRNHVLSRLSVLSTFDKRPLLEEINSSNGIQYLRLLNIDMIIIVLERVKAISERLPSNETSQKIIKQLTGITKKVLRSNNVLSEQMLIDFSSELTRLRVCAQLEKLQFKTRPQASDNTVYSLLSTILNSKIRVAQNTLTEARKLLGEGRLDSNESLIPIAEKSLGKCLSFARDDWSTCPSNHVFYTRTNKRDYPGKKICQQCDESRGYISDHGYSDGRQSNLSLEECVNNSVMRHMGSYGRKRRLIQMHRSPKRRKVK